MKGAAETHPVYTKPKGPPYPLTAPFRVRKLVKVRCEGLFVLARRHNTRPDKTSYVITAYGRRENGRAKVFFKIPRLIKIHPTFHEALNVAIEKIGSGDLNQPVTVLETALLTFRQMEKNGIYSRLMAEVTFDRHTLQARIV